MNYRLLICTLLICLSGSIWAQNPNTDKSKRKLKPKIFMLVDHLAKCEGNIDSLYTANKNESNRYRDNVIIVSLEEDIGDYSRIHVKSNDYDYYFLDDRSFISDDDQQISEGDSVYIFWKFVDNHAIEDSDDTYKDIAIWKIQKTVEP